VSVVMQVVGRGQQVDVLGSLRTRKDIPKSPQSLHRRGSRLRSRLRPRRIYVRKSIAIPHLYKYPPNEGIVRLSTEPLHYFCAFELRTIQEGWPYSVVMTLGLTHNLSFN
jgi:hypothetical protein